MRFTKRIYHDRQPVVGDTIEVIKDNVHSINYGHKAEMVITDTQTFTGDCVWAYHKRSGRIHVVHDNRYRIYTDVTYVKTGEKHVVKRFLGIPFYRKTIDIYEGELTHD